MKQLNYTLNTGRKLPLIGFGTWEIKSDQEVKKAVLDALHFGYRVLDTARIYGNEKGVGEAIKESGIPREEIFVTTKLWNDDQGYDKTMRACEASLDRLGLSYVDLYLIHWPATSRRLESWKAFETLYNDGTIKAAGVSNFTIDHLKELLKHAALVPAVNQVEYHPFIHEQQAALVKFCTKQGILVEAYSPLSRISRETHGGPIKTIAEAHRKTPQQVVLRWCIQHGTLPLPRSTSTEHIKSNLEVLDFHLTDDEMRKLNGLSDGERVTWDPAGMG